MAAPELSFLKPKTPKDMVIFKINSMRVTSDKRQQHIVNKFWIAMLEDLKAYEHQVKETKPFQNTCYCFCSPSCIHKWDKAFWEFKVVGFRRRMYVSEFKYPTKLLSVIFVFVAGVFKLIRANQDGKASFYGNIINIFTNIMVFLIFYADGEGIMLLPKLGSIVVSAAIIYGIISNAEHDGIGI